MTLSLVPELAAADAQMLRSHLLSEASRCLHEAEGALRHRYVTPTAAVSAGADDDAAVSQRSTVGHYLQMYDWDACFFSQVASKLKVADGAFALLPMEIVSNFLGFQQADGHLPRTISPHRIWDSGDVCKPFLCQTLLSTGHAQVEEPVLESLDKYLSYFYDTRRDHSGLYRWRNVLESGVDNNLALLAPIEAAKDENFDHKIFPDGQLLACDLSAYLFAEFSSFAEIARTSGSQELAFIYDQRAREVQDAIETHLWNPALSLYCNLDPRNGELVAVRCWTGMAPVFSGAASAERSSEVIEQNLLSEEHFLRPAGVVSVAASERLYNPARRGLYGRVLVSNWQGPVWVLINGLAVRCLARLGYGDAAANISLRMVNTLINDLKVSGTLHENYHGETGAALFAPAFVSWNIMALEMLDLLAARR